MTINVSTVPVESVAGIQDYIESQASGYGIAASEFWVLLAVVSVAIVAIVWAVVAYV